MKASRLYRFLLQHSRGTIVLMTYAGLFSGLFSAGVLALISHALHQDDSVSILLVAGFMALAGGKIITNVASQLLLVRFSQGNILELSLTLCTKILNAPLRLLERRGGAQILATLTDDVSSLTWAVQCLPQLAMNAAVVLGCGLYLAWLSWRMFLLVVGVTLFGAIIYKVLHDRAFKLIYASREARSRLFDHFRSLTSGIKELIMHRGRREAFLSEEIRPAANDYRRNNLAATTHYAIADAWVQGLYHALIGLLLFAFPLVAKPSPEALTGYVFAMLYMMTPLWSIIGTLPAVARGQVALKKIEELGVSIDSAVRDADDGRVTGQFQNNALVVEMKQVVFGYDDVDPSDGKFLLGPIDFHLTPGELVFVVGGNGSGKSTFVKVLAGLYTPQQGELSIGGRRVSEVTEECYREHFTVVFADFFLFGRLLGLTAPDIENQARHYLQMLRIEHKVNVCGGTFSTIDLSQGQRKRLALVTAYLEDRPIYVFDEWAADQDPEYKHVFYTKLLPELRDRGKAVVVITHDDRFFHLGDRVVKLEDGKIADTWHCSTAESRTATTGH